MTEVGVLLSSFGAGYALPAVAQAVERTGFQSVWAGDHILSSVDGLMACAAAGAATHRIQVGTMVYLPHLRPAVTVARMLATVNAAGLAGRFTFGVGVGGDIPAEFDAVGLDIARRGLELDLSLESIRACFEADAGFSDHGPFPPLWLGGRSIKALRRALRLGSGFAPYLVTLDQYRALRQEIPAAAVQAGFKTAAVLLIAVDTPRSPGREAASRAKPFSLPPHLLDRHLITGPARECARQLSAYAAIGVDHIVLNLAVPPESKHEQLELIAREVVPLLRDHHPPRRAAAQSTRPR